MSRSPRGSLPLGHRPGQQHGQPAAMALPAHGCGGCAQLSVSWVCGASRCPPEAVEEPCLGWLPGPAQERPPGTHTYRELPVRPQSCQLKMQAAASGASGVWGSYGLGVQHLSSSSSTRAGWASGEKWIREFLWLDFL